MRFNVVMALTFISAELLAFLILPETPTVLDFLLTALMGIFLMIVTFFPVTFTVFIVSAALGLED